MRLGRTARGSRVALGLETVLEFRIRGPFEVVEQQRVVVLGGPRQRTLLAILLLRRGEAVSSDRLIDQLWGVRPPATAAKTLQGYVSHLRKALGNDVLLTRGGGYVLAAEPGQVDAVRFEALVTEARHALVNGDAAGARELLGSALELWRGGGRAAWGRGSLRPPGSCWARRSTSGAARRSPIWRTSRSLKRRSGAW